MIYCFPGNLSSFIVFSTLFTSFSPFSFLSFLMTQEFVQLINHPPDSVTFEHIFSRFKFHPLCPAPSFFVHPPSLFSLELPFSILPQRNSKRPVMSLIPHTIVVSPSVFASARARCLMASTKVILHLRHLPPPRFSSFLSLRCSRDVRR